MKDDRALLQEALQEAKLGLREGGLPIGSVLADCAGRIVARGHNLRVQSLRLRLVRVRAKMANANR